MEINSAEENEEKLFLFLPMVFVMAPDIDEEISDIIFKNGGAIDDIVDDSTSHYITNKLPKKTSDQIVYVRPEWVRDCIRRNKLISPYVARYTPENHN